MKRLVAQNILVLVTLLAAPLASPASAQTKAVPATGNGGSKICDLRMYDDSKDDVPALMADISLALKSTGCVAGDIISVRARQDFAESFPEYLCDYGFAIQRYPRASGAAFSCVYAGSVRRFAAPMG